MRIGKWDATADTRAFVIAEVGVNHNGDLARAHDMINLAADVGVDCVKFQTFHADQFCGDPDEQFTYQSRGASVTESMREMFRRYELPDDSWPALYEHCLRRNVEFMTTPQDIRDLELVRGLGLPAIKVGSDDLVNTWLIEQYRDVGLPLILSSGMSEMDELDQAFAAAGWPESTNLAVLVCTSTYPTPAADANLTRIRTLKQRYPGMTVGFSDHTEGYTAAAIARTLGAVIFEKHFTLSHDLAGPDHWFSADPTELEQWVSTIRSTDEYLGDGILRPTESEISMRRIARRGSTALRDIAKGETFSEENIGLRRPGLGIAPARFKALLGLRAQRDIAAWSPVLDDDVQDVETP